MYLYVRTCIYCVYLYLLCFVLFVLCFCIVSFMYMFHYLFCLYCHRVTTQLQLIVVVEVVVVVVVIIIIIEPPGNKVKVVPNDVHLNYSQNDI
jgi:hypothetical protein